MNEASNIKLVQQGYEKFGAGDIPGLLSLFWEGIQWQTPKVENAAFTGDRDGLDSVSEFFAQMIDAEEFTRFEPLEFIAQDDKVVVLGEFAGTVKETGRSYETEWVHLFHIRDDKIVSFKEFLDSAAMAKAFQKATSAEAV
jgi:ketosteroid isomerase-like protein